MRNPVPVECDLNRHIGYAVWTGDVLVRNGKYLVGVRRKVGDTYKTVLCWLVNNELRLFAELPSGGDNSYPGFVEINPDRALVSYYSSHEKDEEGKTIKAIYPAELEIVE